MQVADRAHVIDMLDAVSLRRVVEYERPHLIVPEIEAIATAELLALERDGFTVVPSARAVNLTMNREGIRRLAAEELGLPTSPYRFAATREAFDEGIDHVGLPCVVKPIMSSSGKGQSTVRTPADIDGAWRYAQEGGRAGAGKVIIEGFVQFDYEITQLTVQHAGGVSFLDPVGHIQVHGDYQQSWQPQPMTETAAARARDIAARVTAALGGRGIFGVELFVRGDDVIFSEVSPRPHDTGMVTMISQDLSQFALHARAILGLPIPNIHTHGPSASSVILVDGHSDTVRFGGLDRALAEPDTQVRLFGKPGVRGHRRMGVALARGASIEDALDKARRAAAAVTVEL
jgi:phosphoribosylglycinamide formyltransferase 2